MTMRYFLVTTDCCVESVACSALPNSAWSPITCSCFNYYTTALGFDAADAACKSAAPTGFRGRLAVADDEATYDVLRGLYSAGHAWVALKVTGGVAHTAYVLNVTEWSWYEDGAPLKPLTFVPSAGHGVDVASHICMFITSAGQYGNVGCHAGYKYFCEFIGSKSSVLQHCIPVL